MTPFVIAIGVALSGICLGFGGLLTYIGVAMGYQSADWRRLSPGGRFGLAISYLLMIIGLALCLSVAGWSVMGGGQ
ncbi:hypothetical protein [Halomonas salina]|uniref:DUF4190 domain-containing protein n=1 Tax=Halomonas salina TaxID=42565 RepID=A0ABR4WU66_9GAMM|nr:hypothetical protein [Halomonas salina]KGE78249.1 hypothetical protein FP66_04405 [Halomonas salina]